jgi:uncharacterized membrane protein YfcA
MWLAMSPLLTPFVLALAGALGGAVNALAGGGTLITFPSLLACGVLPVNANATSTIALVPGSFSAFWGFRHAVGDDRRDLWWMALPSVIGGVIGALLVLWAGNKLFARIVPWLIYGATFLFVAQAPIKRWVDRRIGDDEHGHRRRVLQIATQLIIAIYGGFFGAAMGILMLALLGVVGSGDMTRMNGLKNFAAVCINAVAAITFAVGGHVQWWLALWVTVGAVSGGYLAARMSRHIDVRWVRALVIVVGVGMGTYALLKA